jgi:type IV secretory pathway VirB10-like protein
MGELEELIAEIKSNRRFNDLEMEFIHTRAKGILQLMQLFSSRGEGIQESHGLAHQKTESPVIQTKSEEPVLDNEPERDEQPKKAEKTEEETPPPVEPQIMDVQKKELELDAPVSPPEISSREETEHREPVEATGDDDNDDDMLEEESEAPETLSRLGDSFLKGKSVNDLITDQHKLEFKLSNRPVSSIQSAIGINDRFQYTRELFDNDSEKFLEAVKKLDSKENIKEAVDYLRHNYKWKKNETSLKFVNLVKRRFIHE